MATLRMRGLVFLAVAALPACGSSVSGGGAGGSPQPPPKETHAYPGKGFIVHEWGTDTIVVGSDGSLQRGLHHEEEDLPAFVYDRIKAGSLQDNTSVEVKMETPVTYFYADSPRSVNVTVGFPKGIFTQWYPASLSFHPPVAGAFSKLGVEAVRDPVFDLQFPFDTPACAAKYAAVADGMLDWGSVDVLARDDAPVLPDAPLDQFTWSYARDVASNPVRIAGVPGALDVAQHEKFLFYRGLGNFELPVKVTTTPDQGVHLQNTYGEAIPRVFVINVSQGVGDYREITEGIGAGKTLDATIPSSYGLGLDDFVEALGRDVTAALDATGLYHDEAQAMVSTWKRQWFRTPGARLLYLIPQSWTDASIPLTILPEPDETVRVMMIRVELITPDVESDDTSYAAWLGDAMLADDAKAHFQGLGRFAEPRLRRALSLLGNPSYGDAFLASIATADTRHAAGE
jgi:hypothetical protein